jgi:hypothetical protein
VWSVWCVCDGCVRGVCVWLGVYVRCVLLVCWVCVWCVCFFYLCRECVSVVYVCVWCLWCVCLSVWCGCVCEVRVCGVFMG